MSLWNAEGSRSAVPDEVFTPRRILASAGTGKTYTLVGRYLDLVFAGCDPAAILATTFTRAAAAEIRDRVFTDLATLVLDPSKREAQNGDTRFKIGSVDEARAIAALETMVASLPDLQIRTLDSVFAALAGGLGPASGVPADARLVDGEAATDLLREAIGRAMDDADEDEILDTLETLGRGAAKVAVVPTVERAIAGLLATADESPSDAWRWPHPARDERLLHDLRRIDAALEAALDPASPKLDGRLASGLASVRTLVAAAIERDGKIWIDLLGHTLVANAGPGGSGEYYRKPIDESVLPVLAALHAIALGGNLRNLSMRTACLRHLVDAVSPTYRAAKHRAGAAEFDDFVRALDPVRGGLDPDALGELWFRLDTRLEHLLLDEFQDTSATQLRAIRPLAEEIIGGGDGERPRSLLVVGDVKQSLYGWRGGDPAILQRFGTAIGTADDAIPEERLQRSFRSSPAVIDLVNTIFAEIGTSPAVHARSPQAAADFAALWNEHSTAKDQAGEAIVEFLPEKDEDENDTAVIAAAAAASAARLVRRHPDGTVAVIVRSNTVIGPIVEALRERGVDARGQGSGSLLDAEVAIAVIQAFRLAADPDDRLAAEDLARSPLGQMIGIVASSADPDRRVSDSERRAAAASLRRRFDAEGPAAVVDGWRRTLADRLTRREAARVRQMVELLEAFDAEPGSPRSPRAIERHLRTCRVADPGGGGVVVMTVHQSKGLEFDGVVVTETKTPFFREPDLAIATPSVPAGPIEQVATWYAEKARPAEAVAIHQQTIDRSVVESLCGLYVALTRAARDLVVQVPRPVFTKKGDPAATSLPTWGGVVRCAIGRQTEIDATAAEPDGSDDRPVCESPIASGLPGAVVVHRAVHGDPAPLVDAAGSIHVASDAAEDDPADAPIVARSVGPRRRAVAARAASSTHRRADLLRRSDPDALERGSVVHALFEAVERVADLDGRSDDDLLAIARAAAPARDEAWHHERIASVRSALADPSVRAVYDGAGTEGTGDTPTLVRMEFPFLRRTPQGVQTGFIDRLVLHLDGWPKAGGPPPAVVGATIIDFKTDRPDPGAADDLGEFLARHQDQMNDYRSVIAARYDLDPSRISVSLIRVDDAAVVEVPAGEAG